MNREGIMAWTEGEESECSLTGAILIDGRLTCDWNEDQDVGHLEATTTDGVNFNGTYGYPRLEPTRVVTLKRFDSKDDEIAFIGSWTNHSNGYQGVWIIRLTSQ